MVDIIFYGGVAEVGGNKILVKNEGTRIFLDFGTSMGYESNFFAEFLKPRTNTGLKDRLIIGSLPRIPGIYRRDLLIPDGMENISNEKYKRILDSKSQLLSLPDIEMYDEYKEREKEGYVKAIFLSHAHFDHSGAIGYIHQEIPMYCSKTTEAIVNAIDDVSSFKSKAIVSKSSELKFVKEKAAFPFSPSISHNQVYNRTCVPMKDTEEVDFKNIKVKHIEQDHSIPGTSSFVITASDKKILYTGDIRFHGTHPLTIDEYVSKVGKNIDIMICEGTRIDSDRIITEEDVQKKIEEQIKSTKGIVFIDFGWKDTTRYETIKKAVDNTGRTFVINARLAYILGKLNMFPENDNVKVFIKRKESCLYSPSDYSKSKHELGFDINRGKGDIDLTHYENAISALEIMESPEKYVVMFSFFDLQQMFDFADTNGKVPGSLFIRAQCSPFSDDMELDEERFINWLEEFGIDFIEDDIKKPEGCENDECPKLRRRMDRSHTSGHASRPELKELIEKIDPKIVIPVHTPHPELFNDMIKEIGKNIQVVIPEKEKSYTF